MDDTIPAPVYGVPAVVVWIPEHVEDVVNRCEKYGAVIYKNTHPRFVVSMRGNNPSAYDRSDLERLLDHLAEIFDDIPNPEY